MTDESKPRKTEIQVEILELNRETIQDLTEQQGDQAGGGMAPQTPNGCNNQCTEPETGCL
jgi:hypothetical protein